MLNFIRHKRQNNFDFFLIVLLLSFLVIIFTGIQSDDFTAIYQAEKTNLKDFFSWSIEKRGQNFFGIFNHYLFYWAYEVFTIYDNIIFDLLKILVNFISFILVFIFINQYLDKYKSLLFSIFFVFSFIHDSSIFWYMTSPYIFTAAMIMFAHYIINRNNFLLGIPLLIFSSLLSYSSPPYIFGLSFIFLFEKKIKKFILFNFIGFLYICYYFYFGILNNGEIRIDSSLGITFFLKNLIIQLFSSIDSLFGISFVLKLYNSTLYNNYFTLVIIFFILLFFYRSFDNKSLSKNNLILFLSFLIIYFSSLLMFSLTGLYAQSTFNLGNRVTIYGCLVLSYLFTYFVKGKFSFLLILTIILLPLFGLSNYWKAWNSDQINIIENIKNNTNFSKIDNEATLLIHDNLYVKLGNINHIEFFIQPWVVRSIFNAEVNTTNFMAITKHIKITNDTIIDTKFNESIKIKNNIYIYDTSKNKLFKVSRNELVEFYKNIDFGKRHWLQLINNVYINNILLRLSPRLNLYFKNV
jgi:hypothetical protein